MIFASAGYTVSLYDIEPKQVSMVSRQGRSQDPTTDHYPEEAVQNLTLQTKQSFCTH